MLFGIDVSHWQEQLDWPLLKKSNVAFAFVKATQGIDWVDPWFVRNWSALKAAGIVRGAYHYFLPTQDPLRQARHFCSAVGQLEPGDLPLVLDVEVTGGLTPKPLAQSILTCLQEIERFSGVRPIVYTAPYFWNANVANPAPWSATYPLWIAHYTSASKPTLPNGWNRWVFWQNTNAGRLPGYTGDLDFDHFTGTEEDLRALTVSHPSNEMPPSNGDLLAENERLKSKLRAITNILKGENL